MADPPLGTHDSIFAPNHESVMSNIFPSSYVSLPSPLERMEFSGERYVSGVDGEIAYEHYLRYLFGAQFCSGKRVLDLACGEGYGSCILSCVAAHVVGVDVDPAAITFAAHNYSGDTREFRVGDATAVPAGEAEFDVVISFETLEHLTHHDLFLSEITRVLVPDGLLVMSSPDAHVYLRDAPERNPYHLKELTKAEFCELINKYFNHCSFGRQKATTGAFILPDLDNLVLNNSGITFFTRQNELDILESSGLCDATYLIAIASNQNLPEIRWGILDDPHYLPELRLVQQQEFAKLHNEVARLAAEVTRLSGELRVARESAEANVLADIAKVLKAV